ncbi:MAG: histidine kinase [Bacteroidales bacterium]|nr:histidine kinase [Bacteroidales bacterium]
MIKYLTKYLIIIAAVFCSNLTFAQQHDSLFNESSVVKLFYLENSDDNTIVNYIIDTASWIKTVNIGLADLKNNNELLVKTIYVGNEYNNPALVLVGLSSGFQLYRDSILIYSAGKRFNSNNPGRYFDTHIIPLEKPLTGSAFVLRIHFKSYLDITGFSVAIVGETAQVAYLAKEHKHDLQNSELSDFILGIFLLIAGFMAFATFFLRFKIKDWLLFWFFLFAASQGYVFIMDYLMIILNISPTFLIASTVIVENLVPIGIIGIIAMITGFSKNFFIRLLMLLHVIYTALHLSLIHFDFYNIIFWILVIADIIMFVIVFIKSKIYKNPNFRIPVIAICTLMILVILDIFAVFGVFYISEDLSSYGMLFVAISFAWYIERAFFRSRQQNLKYQIEITEANNSLLNIENQNVIAQYETLKNQVNPHFLFNSLNILSSLIRHDDKKALQFIEEFADIYRYVLDANDKTLVVTKKEIEFVNSYLFLQKLRYGKNFEVQYKNIDAIENSLIVPLSVQILVENAIKHNEISAEYPLEIIISVEENYLTVRNRIQKLNFEPESKKIGLNNLSARYAIITDQKVSFGEHNNSFIAKIPLLKLEDYENESFNN